MNAVVSLPAQALPSSDATTSMSGDDFQLPKKSKKKQGKRVRVYIGNLPLNIDGLEALLLEFLSEKGSFPTVLSENDIFLEQLNNNGNSCHAFLSCPSNQAADNVIASMNRQVFCDRTLTVQRERNPKRDFSSKTSTAGKTNQNRHQQNVSSFGKKSWSKPPPGKMKAQSIDDGQNKQIRGMNAQLKVEKARQGPEYKTDSPNVSTNIVKASKIEKLATNTSDSQVFAKVPEIPNVPSTLSDIVSGGHQMSSDVINIHCPLEQRQETMSSTLGDFKSRCQQPLSELMNDYGDEDPDWRAFQPTLMNTIEKAEETLGPSETVAQQSSEIDECGENRLGRQGKAPIHIEFISFGYAHGVPAAIRNGWSHAQPLSAFDCRDLPEVPGHLLWRNGCSGLVQSKLMAEPEVKTMSTSVAEETFSA